MQEGEHYFIFMTYIRHSRWCGFLHFVARWFRKR